MTSPPEPQRIPDPALVVLVGPSGAGKSFWARARYRSPEIVSSDDLRAVVGSGPADIEASVDAFALLDRIVAARVRRRLTAVIDTVGMETTRRLGYLALARAAGLPAVAVLVNAPTAVCRSRNAIRDRPVPAPALEAQIRRMRVVQTEIDEEGWDLTVEVDGSVSSATDPQPIDAPGQDRVGDAGGSRGAGPDLILQISRFPWGNDPAGWLTSVAGAAAESGFAGLALMDHLIQIPQVGRAWDPIPEPFVTLGLLAAAAPGLRLGTLVTPVTFRPPGILAKSLATLDALTGGRAFCGIGAGWWEREHRGFGLPFPPARERLDGVAAAIEMMRALWSTGTKPYLGDRVELPETTCYPRPVGDLPIIVGGRGNRTLRIVARLADGCNLPSATDVLDDRLAVLRAECAAVGRSSDEIEVTVLDLPLLDDDREQLARTVERLRGRTPASTFAARHHAGPGADHVARYRMLAARGVRTVFVAPPDLAGPEQVRRFAPVIAALR